MKHLALRALYASGLLGLYHRWRNRRALTVISFHRVIAPSDPRWQSCDPLYTMSDRLFDQCLAFLSRHYSVVSLAEVAKARSSTANLPDCPLLITFDDGWADNHEFALPALQRRRLPAALFVASDVLDRRDAFFQERIIAAWRRHRLTDRTLMSIWQKVAAGSEPTSGLQSEAAVRRLISALQSLPVTARESLLASVAPELVDDTRHMLTVEQLRALRIAGIAIGTHGKQHEALTRVADPAAELQQSKLAVAAALTVDVKEIDSLSFPFSKHSAAIVELARRAGYRLLFGGGLSLNPVHAGLPDLISRVGICAPDVADANGNLVSHTLAVYLFRRPHRALAAG